MGLNVEKIREDFPVLKREIHRKPIIYMDSACMTMRPMQVIDKINEYYKEYPACGERSSHKLGKKVDEGVDRARENLKKFINAKSTKEIIFTKNTTEGLNLLANTLELKKGDVVLGTDKEHNSNLIPWQMLASNKGIKHDFVKSKHDNSFSVESFQKKMTKDVKVVSIVHTSNMDGVTVPIKDVIKIAHDNGSLVIVDGAQSVPHYDVNVRKLDVDFLAFSGHKMLGPSGTGVLYGKEHLLEDMGTFMVGGGMVEDTTYTKTKLEGLPQRFEAGLQNYAGIIGLGEAASYLMKIGKDNIRKHEANMNKMITEALGDIVDILGPKEPDKRAGIFSFNYKKADPHEIAMMLDEMDNICVRAGAHCVQSWFNANNLDGSVRASLYLYNTMEECDKFVETLKKVIDVVK
jgi:cysteine desulfurase/selenocysteine lyase